MVQEATVKAKTSKKVQGSSPTAKDCGTDWVKVISNNCLCQHGCK